MTQPERQSGPPAPRATVTEGDDCLRTLEVEVPPQFVQEAGARVLQRYMSRVRVRGFRKGRVPAEVVQRQYGDSIAREGAELAVEQATRHAIDSNGLRPVSEVRIGDTRMTDDGGLTLTATFEVQPQVRLGRLGGFRIESPSLPRPGDEAVDGFLERLRAERATWHTEEEGRPGYGDQVTVTLTRRSGDEESRSYDLTVGHGQALPDVEEAIQTMAPGESGDFDIAFPDDHPDPERAGTTHPMHIELVSLRVAELPDVDDDFARAVSDADDLEDLRKGILSELEGRWRMESERALRSVVFRTVVEANPFDVPSTMVDAYLDSMVSEFGDLNEEQEAAVRDELRPAAVLALRRDLMVDAIGREHDLEPSRQEVSEFVTGMARRMDQSPSSLRSRLRRSGELKQLEKDMTAERVFAFLKEKSEII